jgi:hypothetical protein
MKMMRAQQASTRKAATSTSVKSASAFDNEGVRCSGATAGQGKESSPSLGSAAASEAHSTGKERSLNMRELINLVPSLLLATGLSFAASGALADEQSSKEQGQGSVTDSQGTKPAAHDPAATSDQASSAEHKRTTEQSSAGDQGTVNESQDPLTSDRTPHESMKDKAEKSDIQQKSRK